MRIIAKTVKARIVVVVNIIIQTNINTRRKNKMLVNLNMKQALIIWSALYTEKRLLSAGSNRRYIDHKDVINEINSLFDLLLKSAKQK